MAKKRPLLWFEEPLDDFRGMKDDFFGNMQEVFRKPFLNLDKLIKVPDFKSRFIPIKMADTDNELILRAEMPGFSKDEIKLKVTPDTFLISAEKKRHSIDKSEKSFRMEKDFSSTSRAITLPEEVKTEGVKTKFENGVLEVVMPKKEIKKKEEKNINIY
jgi:HSP20 family protein